VGLLFSAGIYPVTVDLWNMNKSDCGDDMGLSLYFALGIFLLMAVRNPSANRSLIAFTAWSSFAHGTVMLFLAFHLASEQATQTTADKPVGVANAEAIRKLDEAIAPYVKKARVTLPHAEEEISRRLMAFGMPSRQTDY
jgi:uncharacterized protein DUF6632